MPARRLSALVLACALLAVSCVQGSASPPEADPGAVGAPGTLGPEPIAEDREPFGSKAFPFVVDVPDDEIATDASKVLLPGWEGPEALFCIKFVDEMNRMFRDRYRDVGARVTRR